MSIVKKVIKGIPARDGAGVSLTRVLGRDTLEDFDPFLMMDSFDSTEPDEYMNGFPEHPHRGIETLTYLVDGGFSHRDSLGNKGQITAGSAQWMTAGSGIMHEEMPIESERLLGLQLWINLPSEDKMTTPKYFDIKKEDFAYKEIEGGLVKVLSGELDGLVGVKPNHLQVDFYEIYLEKDSEYSISKIPSKNSFLFNIEGKVEVDSIVYEEKSALLLDDSEKVTVKAIDGPLRIIFVQGKKLKEPIAWAGPIVMNTTKEIQEAYKDLREGTFIKDKISL